MNSKVIFRVDGNSNIGLGHLVRCISLARLLKKEFKIQFVCKEIPDQIIKELSDDDFDTHIIQQEIDFFEIIKPEYIVVLDGYSFDTSYQKIVKSKGCKLVCIDDMHDKKFVCDLIINHGPNEIKDNYQADSSTNFALGHKFLLLREEFYNEMQNKRVVKDVENLLIILGGSDLKGLSLELIQNGININFKHVHVVVGASNKNLAQLIELAKEKLNVSIYYNLGASDIISLTKKCEICICTPSGIAYEMACIGIGIVLCMIAENQIHFYNFYIEKELAVGLSFAENQKNGIHELLKLVKISKNNLSAINMQIQNQKKIFSKNPHQNILDLFNTLK